MVKLDPYPGRQKRKRSGPTLGPRYAAVLGDLLATGPRTRIELAAFRTRARPERLVRLGFVEITDDGRFSITKAGVQYVRAHV